MNSIYMPTQASQYRGLFVSREALITAIFIAPTGDNSRQRAKSLFGGSALSQNHYPAFDAQGIRLALPLLSKLAF